MVNYRYLGNSGLKVSEITYGNWVTHASQVEDDAAVATVHAALDAGITTFDTADTYANTAAEVILGKALAGQRRTRRKSRSQRSTRSAPAVTHPPGTATMPAVAVPRSPTSTGSSGSNPSTRRTSRRSAAT